MVKKWAPTELNLGAIMEATFWPNPVKDSGFRFRATHLDGRKAPKVVLCDDVRIRPGIPCQVPHQGHPQAQARRPRRTSRSSSSSSRSSRSRASTSTRSSPRSCRCCWRAG